MILLLHYCIILLQIKWWRDCKLKLGVFHNQKNAFYKQSMRSMIFVYLWHHDRREREIKEKERNREREGGDEAKS